MRFLKAAFVSLLLIGAFSAAQPAFAENCSGRNSDTPLIAMSAQGAATVTSPDISNCMGRGLILVLDLTTTTTATVTITIQGKDLASGKYYTLLAGAAKTANGTTIMTIYPGAAVTANVSANEPLPRTWNVSITIANNSGTAAVTGTAGASVIN